MNCERAENIVKTKSEMRTKIENQVTSLILKLRFSFFSSMQNLKFEMTFPCRIGKLEMTLPRKIGKFEMTLPCRIEKFETTLPRKIRNFEMILPCRIWKFEMKRKNIIFNRSFEDKFLRRLVIEIPKFCAFYFYF